MSYKRPLPGGGAAGRMHIMNERDKLLVLLPSEDGQRQQDAERTARRLESRARSALETARALREGATG